MFDEADRERGIPDDPSSGREPDAAPASTASRGRDARDAWRRITGLPLVHPVFMERESGHVGAYLRQRLLVPEASSQRDLVLLMSPARCASTALLTALSLSGLPPALEAEDLDMVRALHHYQPIKMLLRRGSGALDRDLGAVQVDHGTRVRFPALARGALANRPIVHKEVYGPYAETEIFDAAAIMREAGYAAERMCALFLFRQPEHCWDSWRRTFATDTSFALFAAAYKEAYRQFLAAGESCRKALAITSEALAAETREQLVPALCDEIGVPYSREALLWSESPYFAVRTVAHTEITDKNPARFFVGVSTDHRARGRLCYVPAAPRPLPDDERRKLREHGLFEIYDAVVADMERRFALTSP